MGIFRRVRSFLHAIWKRNQLERETQAELQFHLEACAEDLMKRRGLSREAALREARIAFGSVDKSRENIREARGLRLFDELIRNGRYAFRQFRRNPGFTLTVVLILALGIGANTAIFSIFYNFLLRALPVQEPERLVNLSSTGPMPGYRWGDPAGGTDERFSYPMYRDLEQIQTVFTGIGASSHFAANLAVQNETRRGLGLLVSGNYFPVLGVHPALGRLLDPRDDTTIGESHVVVLSHAYWKNRFGLNPNVLNQAMVVNGQNMTIVGVTQAGFQGTTPEVNPQVFVPFTMAYLMDPNFRREDMNNRQSHWTYLFARLKPGITLEQARTALNDRYAVIINEVEAPAQRGLSGQELGYFKTKSIVLDQGAQGRHLALGAITRLMMLFGITALVLVIAFTNVANLHLARGAARAHEIAVRLSIGASRMQVVRQLLTESCLLALLAGGAGLLVAQWTLLLIRLLMSSLYSTMGAEPPAQNFLLNTPTLLFTAAVALGTSLLFGLFPALHSTRLDLASSLKEQAGQPAGARSTARFRRALAMGQIALSLALLVVAGLFVKSLYNISHTDIGLQVDQVVSFTVSPTVNGYTPPRSLQLFERLEDGLAALPGTTSVTDSLIRLFSGTEIESGSLRAVDNQVIDPKLMMSVSTNKIGPAYFRTLGIPLLAGREFTRSDTSGSPRVVIVNEAFARYFHLGPEIVGRSIRMGGGLWEVPVEVVGLAQNAKHVGLKRENVPQMFFPYRQPDRNPVLHLTFYVRTSLPPDQVFPVIRDLMARLDPNLPVEDLYTVPQQIRQSLTLERGISLLTTLFAGLATLLAAIGLYGVLAYTVTQRTREFGLRMVLGASRVQVRAMVFQQVGGMILIGGAVGLILAIGLGRLAESTLYQLKGYDPLVLIGSTLILALVATAAGFLPAYRASRVDPAQALRFE